jgi:hypothetical protein
MSKPESFYYIFEYGHMMHDAIDHGLVYECIKITRDIETESGKILKKDDTYEAVWFLWDKQLFQFIDWIPDSKGSHNYIPDPKTLVEIPQSELARFTHWNVRPDGTTRKT